MTSGWARLPREVRSHILQTLMQDGCKVSRLATVCRDWQTELERYNFARIKVTPSRLVDFGSMIHRNQALVDYIWFCLELDEYDCMACAPNRRTLTLDEYEEAFSINDADGFPLTTAFQNLFSVLSTWVLKDNLVLDISIYSPSDSKHWFPYLTFMPDIALDMLGDGMEQAIPNKVYNDPQHGWVTGFRYSPPPHCAICKVFHPIMEEGPFDSQQLELEWWDQLPPVPAITTILLRQQNRRRWKPRSLAHMFSRFPRLQEVHYEPWREWDSLQRYTERGSRIANSPPIRYPDIQYLFEAIPRFNKNLKRLVVFENFNQQYTVIMHQVLSGHVLSECDSHRKPTPAVSRMVALASLNLEHLAASFIVDASHFFDIEPSWEWPNLRSIVLTSSLLTPDEDPIEIGVMLQAAAAAAMKMPRLETMEIWNGRQGSAALFKYQVFHDRQEATITWRGTWQLTMEPSLIQAWEVVVGRYGGYRLNSVPESLHEAAIKSHADAIHHLMLSSPVIRPISLQQIQREQKCLEGVPTFKIETCHLCSRPVYPSKGITFVRNDAKVFRFCRSKCHKNFKMKRQPRKLKWTKTHRALRGKEMIVDQNLLLSQFAKRRHAPVKYDRNLVQATMRAMERIEEIRARRERVYTRRRLSGKAQRDARRRQDLKVVAQGEHLIKKELADLEAARAEMEPMVEQIKRDLETSRVVGEERLRQKRKRKMLVGGGTEEDMDLD
ncbi:hypothetical protein AYO20_10468 [Fonsecaea nubica]|uniref:Ribosome biogenesis protein RLP24 n=1 Tax=Fonsecaea nubica TaxID=856822 RepID=A0A178C7N1_9EURO|nr:hypothetical protein AYO20_10468 [Fonsecaea nubica]OAL25434.1 hypothetical protein AYO20_10468 [Fonsecaea nubica]